MAVSTRGAQVAKTLVQRIADGEYPVGTLLPTELELAKAFAVSRATVRTALRELQEAGMITRTRNTGTRVEAVKPIYGPESYIQRLASIEDVVQFGADTKREVREIVEIVTDAALSERLGCPIWHPWLRVSSVRISRTKSVLPLGWTDVYVEMAYAAVVKARIRDYTGLVASLIWEDTGLRTAEVRQYIRATGVPAAVAPILKAEPGSYALQIDRHYVDAKGHIFVSSCSFHPADRFLYEVSLLPMKSPSIFSVTTRPEPSLPPVE